MQGLCAPTPAVLGDYLEIVAGELRTTDEVTAGPLPDILGLIVESVLRLVAEPWLAMFLKKLVRGEGAI